MAVVGMGVGGGGGERTREELGREGVWCSGAVQNPGEQPLKTYHKELSFSFFLLLLLLRRFAKLRIFFRFPVRLSVRLFVRLHRLP